MTAHNDNHSHGTVKSYIVGFVLSILLTLAPYYLVVYNLLQAQVAYIAIAIFALAQLLVQVVFFLHMTSEDKPRWNLTAFIFTAFAALLFVVGSLWIMYNLDYNMMMHH